MTKTEAKKLLKTLNQEQKKELLLLLVSLPNLDEKVKAIENRLNIKLKD